ncbi:MAG: PT domain-containing protein, partial [Chloroflexota bacterium]
MLNFRKSLRWFMLGMLMILVSACGADRSADLAVETIMVVTPPPTATQQPSPTPWPTATSSPTATTPPTPTSTPNLTATWEAENLIVLDQDYSFEGIRLNYSDKLFKAINPSLQPPRVDGFRTLDRGLPNFEGVPNHIVLEILTDLPSSRPPIMVVQSIVDENNFFYPAYDAEEQEYFNELRRISITRPRLDFFYESEENIIGAQYTTFQNGKGVSSLRYMPSSDEPEEITNRQLFYVYEGITDKGNFYVWAQIPVRIDSLQDAPSFSENQINVLSADANNYAIYKSKELEKIVRANEDGAVFPDRSVLNELISSLSVADTAGGRIASADNGQDSTPTPDTTPLTEDPEIPGVDQSVTEVPIEEPTAEPTEQPTETPTVEPTATLESTPTSTPTEEATATAAATSTPTA